jgi:hypothetical protein
LGNTQQKQVEVDDPSPPTNVEVLKVFKKDTTALEDVPTECHKQTSIGHKSSKGPVYTVVSPTAESQIPPPAAADKVKYTPIGGFKNKHVSLIPLNIN